MEQNYKHRIQRLLKIIVEIKTEPNLTVGQLRRRLGVSKSQLYKDRATLAEIGFSFEYSRTDKKFVVTRDMTLPVENLTLSEQLSLVMALRHLSASGDHVLTY